MKLENGNAFFLGLPDRSDVIAGQIAVYGTYEARFQLKKGSGNLTKRWSKTEILEENQPHQKRGEVRKVQALREMKRPLQSS